MCESFTNDYNLCEEIGRGRFGVVHRCFSAASGDSFAVKSVDKLAIEGDPLDSRCLDAEPKLLLLLSGHPNILQIHNLYNSDSHLHIVTDLCNSATLFDRLASAAFSESAACSVFSQLASAVAHCHRHGVAHRDLKPENVLFDSFDRLKLCDFGSAEWFLGSDGERSPMRGVVGTPYYIAPEILAGREYCEKVDVWSAGVILYIMLAGVPPFYGETAEETFHAVVRANLRFPARLFRSVSPLAKDLVRKMLCKDADRRLSAEQVLRHPWVVNGGNTG